MTKIGLQYLPNLKAARYFLDICNVEMKFQCFNMLTMGRRTLSPLFPRNPNILLACVIATAAVDSVVG